MLPWMRFYTRDWLDNKELRRCSASSRAILADLMCLAHEGVPYGHLADKVGPLTTDYMAARCVVKSAAFVKAVGELMLHGRIAKADGGAIFIPRLVEEEELRLSKSEAGRKGGNPNLVNHDLNSEVNQEDKLARARADSGSDSCSYSLKSSKKEEAAEAPTVRAVVSVMKSQVPPSALFETWWAIWSGVRGTNHRIQAENAYFRVVNLSNEADCLACAKSYLDSLENPGKGYNPEKFLDEQSQDAFRARWPVRAPPKSKQDLQMERVLARAREEDARNGIPYESE